MQHQRMCHVHLSTIACTPYQTPQIRLHFLKLHINPKFGRRQWNNSRLRRLRTPRRPVSQTLYQFPTLHLRILTTLYRFRMVLHRAPLIQYQYPMLRRRVPISPPHSLIALHRAAMHRKRSHATRAYLVEYSK